VLKAEFTPGKTERRVDMKARQYGGRVTRVREYLNDVIDELGPNPIDFLLAKGQRRKELLLEAIPMTVTATQLRDATGREDIREVQGHALEVISAYTKDLFDERTGVNRALKEAQTGVMRLIDTLPPEAPDGEWAGEVARREQEMKRLETVHLARRQSLTQASAEVLTRLRDQATNTIQQLTDDAEASIRAIRTKLDEQINRLKDEGRAAIEEERTQERRALEQLSADLEPVFQEALRTHERAKTMHEQSVRAEGARALLRTMQEEMAQQGEASAKLTAALDGLNALKDELTRDLPIAGLEVKDGDILLHGRSIDVINEASRVMLAAQLAKLRVGPLGLIVIDGLERLDRTTQQEFFRIFGQDETVQLIGAEVADPTDEHPETDTFHVMKG
jgi:hypothetical protein